MSFEENLRLALDPSELLPRELHLGANACSWTNGKFSFNGTQLGFRQMKEYELRQLMCKLQAARQHHVIFLNLRGHGMGEAMMRELASPIAALKALQVLILSGTYSPHPSTAPISPPLPLCLFFWHGCNGFFDLLS